MRKSTILILALAVLLAGSASAQAENTGQMIFPGTDWIETTPEAQGVDSTKLNAAISYLESQSGCDGVREMVVIRNGYMIWKGDNVDYMHRTWSIGKVFTSTVLGLLIDDGECTLDDLASNYESILSPLYSGVTIRHLATMMSGYDAVGGPRWENPVPESGDWSPTPYIPDAPLFSPGTEYCYWDEAMMVFGRVLTIIADQDILYFLKDRITDHIGMGSWDWDIEGSVNGIPIRLGAGHVWTTARQLARFGHLFLNHGNWNGTQLISTDWVNQAIQNHVPTDIPVYGNIDGRGVYGYHWWLNGIRADGTRLFADAPIGTFYRSGWPRQRMFIIPEWNMVIVRIGVDNRKTDLPADPRACWNTVLKMVGEAVTIENPTCQDVIDNGLLITGDISGPDGTPDCYVNLYDIAALACNWLYCNNPQDSECNFSY